MAGTAHTQHGRAQIHCMHMRSGEYNIKLIFAQVILLSLAVVSGSSCEALPSIYGDTLQGGSLSLPDHQLEPLTTA